MIADGSCGQVQPNHFPESHAGGCAAPADEQHRLSRSQRGGIFRGEQQPRDPRPAWGSGEIASPSAQLGIVFTDRVAAV